MGFKMKLTILCCNCKRNIRENVEIGYKLDDILKKYDFYNVDNKFYCADCYLIFFIDKVSNYERKL